MMQNWNASINNEPLRVGAKQLAVQVVGNAATVLGLGGFPFLKSHKHMI